MWPLVVPLALCACEGDGMLVVVVGVIALVLMQQHAKPSAPRVYGPAPHVSARVSETESRQESDEAEEHAAERVPNPRKMSTDLTETTETETALRVPNTHIVGFRWNPSSESRARLLARQHKEMKQYTLHQYE